MLLYLCLSLFLIEMVELEKFPKGFLLGYSTSSYQIEGGWNADGKGESLWDNIAHNQQEYIRGGTNADVACDSYHKYMEDVQLLKHLNAQIYRFSVSWTRILPTGDTKYINQPGIDYYNSLIDELLKNGIEPMIVLYYWDLPLTLNAIGGWLNSSIVDYFEGFARIAFQNFGDRVKWWSTLNQPFHFCRETYRLIRGNEVYVCGHNMIIAHARAYRLYDSAFRAAQKGQVGIDLDGDWLEPATDSALDVAAAETLLQFQIGWFAHPILTGDYPPAMRKRIDSNSRTDGWKESRLPYFDPEMVGYVKGTTDFLGMQHFQTQLVSDNPEKSKTAWERDTGSVTSSVPLTNETAEFESKSLSWGFRKMLNWIKNEYDNVTVFVTRNGYSNRDTLKDYERIAYHKNYIRKMLNSIYTDGCNIVGYSIWSLMDTFGWYDGYERKYGVYRVNFRSPDRTRRPKASVDFFRRLFATRELPEEWPET